MSTPEMKPIAILGAGSWGTALALYLSRRGQTVRVWSVDPTEIHAMQTERANNRFMPGHTLPETLHPTADLAEAVADVEDILMVVPSIGFRQTLMSVKPHLNPNARIICATKGLDANTGELLNHVTEEVLGKAYPFAVLSGPSFAKEVAAGLPCAVVIASEQDELLPALTQRFNSNIFRTYSSHDVIGVEIGGVAKNVIAIATGIIDGMNLGANARSALITRGLAEIMRLGVTLGGKQETFVGLSGLGDLILTCSDNLSRNRRFGLAIGEGKSVAEAEKAIGQVVEGKRNAELVLKLAKLHNVDMPICEMVWQILQGEMDAEQAINQLLSRSPKSE
jgi:glycerol-3-phosphate dehydrogenase (NAD(P)+)